MSGSAPGPRPRSRRRLWILIAIVVGLPVLGGGAWVLRQYQRQRLAETALAEGKAAFEKGDWETARQQLGRYLGREQDDFEILGKYAVAQLNCRPLPMENIQQAANAYRRMLRIQPQAVEPFERLSTLYLSTGNVTELGQIAESRRSAVGTGDLRAGLAALRVRAAQRQVEKTSVDEFKSNLDNQQPSDAVPEQFFVEGYAALVELANTDDTETARKDTEAFLDAALKRFPKASLLLGLRAGIHTAWAMRSDARTPGRDEKAAEALREAAKADLAAACDPLPDDPRVLLALSETAMILRELDRAKTLLDHARGLSDAAVAAQFIDPEAFEAAWFQRAGALAAVSGHPDQGVALAEQVIDPARLTQKRSRIEALPLAVELLARGGKAAQARKTLDEYLDLIAPLPQGTISPQQVAMLKAVVAMAEGKPYDVINLLEPLSKSSSFPALGALMLNEAYVATNQSIRIASAGAAAGDARGVMALSQARSVVQALAERGDWEAVRKTLTTVGDAAKTDPDLRVYDLGARLELALARKAPPSELNPLIAEAKAARTEFPRRADLAILLASISQISGDTAGAKAELERAAKECEPADLPLIALARLEAADKHDDRAAEWLREATQREPKRISAWLALAGLQFQTGKGDDALKTLDEAIAGEAANDPDRKGQLRQLRRSRALLLLSRGDRKAGEEALRAMAEESASDVEVRSLLLDLPDGLTAPNAQPLVDQIKAVEGDAGIRWRYYQARVWLAGKDWQSHTKEARDLLAYCIAADPSWTGPVLVLGGLQRRTGDLTGAEATYRAGFANTQDSAVGDQLFGLLQSQGRASDASEVLRRMDARLNDQAASARRVTLAIGQGQFGEAIKELEKRGSAITSEEQVLRAQLTYAKSRDVSASMRDLDEAEKAGADPLVVARVRASIYQSADQKEKALDVLNAVVATLESAGAYRLRGSFLASIGQIADADADFAKARSLSEDDIGYAVEGEHLAQTNRLNEAIGIWEAGLAKFPDSVVLMRGLVKAKIMRNQPGDPPAVAKLLESLESARPGDAEVIWLQASDLYRRDAKKFAATILDRLNQATEAPFAPADVFRGLAGLALQMGDAKLMLSLTLRGLTFHPTDPVLQVQRAEALIGQGDWRAVREAARAALKTDPANLRAIELLALAAQQLKEAGGYDEPIAALESICGAKPDDEPANVLLAQVLRAKGDAAASRKVLRDLSERAPAAAGSIVVLLESAESARADGDAAAAEMFLGQAETAAPDDPRVLQARLIQLSAARKFDEIASFAEKRLDRPETLPLLLGAAATLSEQPPQFDAAIRLANRALRHDPQNAPAQFLIGNIEYGRGNVDAAQKAFEAAVAADPTAAAPRNNLAWLLANDRGQYAPAEVLAREAVKLAPNEPNYHDTLAFILDRKGDAVGAAAEYVTCFRQFAPEQRPSVLPKLLKLAKQADRSKGEEVVQQLRPLLADLQQLKKSPVQPLTPEQSAALDALIASLGAPQ